MAMVPRGSGKGQNRALVCGGQMEQEGKSRMVKVLLVLVGLRAWSQQLPTSDATPAQDTGVSRIHLSSARLE